MSGVVAINNASALGRDDCLYTLRLFQYLHESSRLGNEQSAALLGSTTQGLRNTASSHRHTRLPHGHEGHVGIIRTSSGDGCSHVWELSGKSVAFDVRRGRMPQIKLTED